MITKRNIGRVAAIGGLTATIALLTGLPAASADELADLRANQELLQRRLDQLSQVPSPLGAPGTTGGSALGTQAVPGVPLAGGSFPRSFLIPGTDTSLRVGGFVDETLDYYLVNGPPNGNQSTTIQTNGNLQAIALNIHGQQVPGFPTLRSATSAANEVPVNVQHSRGNGIFLQSPRESRLNVETRTPTAWGESRTFIEFDFAGTNNFSGQSLTKISDNLIPRLRYAYGTLGGFLAGQAKSNFSDADAEPETLDFGGPVGEAGVVRVPQVRYTIAGPYGSAFSVSLETPQTNIVTPAGNVSSDSNTGGLPGGPGGIVSGTGNGCVANGLTITATTAPPAAAAAGCTLAGNPARSPAPDITFASYWAQPWGHIDFRLVGRDLQVQDGRFVDRRFFGYGGGVSFDVKPGWFGWVKDDIQFQFTAGTGICGRYQNDSSCAELATNYLATPTSAAAAANVIIRPISSIGGVVGYQHWWLPNLRSNIAYGYELVDYPSQLIGPSQSIVSNDQLMTAHVNLIWNPVAFIDTGIEYTWGQRRVVAQIYGNQQALVGKFRVKF
jgi:hypothetical protein